MTHVARTRLSGYLLLLSAGISHAQASDFVIDSVRVLKAERRLELMQGNRVARTYKVALGGEPVGHKQKEGDQKTPEGAYVLDYKKADSAFHLSIHISYPNEQDRVSARQKGVSPGGAIMIHGQRNGLGWLGGIAQRFDWTDGCIAVSNQDMDEIWRLVQVGTPIQILQ